MGYIINVDTDVLDDTANTIDNYVKCQKDSMIYLNKKVLLIKEYYKGTDADEFQKKWQNINSSTSSSKLLLNGLESYSRYLKYASESYKEAKNNAINRAKMLL